MIRNKTITHTAIFSMPSITALYLLKGDNFLKTHDVTHIQA